MAFIQGGLGAKYSRKFSLKINNPTEWTPGSQPLSEAAKGKHQTNRKTDNPLNNSEKRNPFFLLCFPLRLTLGLCVLFAMDERSVCLCLGMVRKSVIEPLFRGDGIKDSSICFESVCPEGEDATPYSSPRACL